MVQNSGSQYISSNKPSTRGTSASKLIKATHIESKTGSSIAMGKQSVQKRGPDAASTTLNSAQLPVSQSKAVRNSQGGAGTGTEINDQNAMQMFYGDYQFWDGDEPEEDE